MKNSDLRNNGFSIKLSEYIRILSDLTLHKGEGGAEEGGRGTRHQSRGRIRHTPGNNDYFVMR